MLLATAIVLSSLGMITFAAEANTNVYNGNYACAITIADSDSFKQWGGGLTITVKADTDYTITAWSKGSGSG